MAERRRLPAPARAERLQGGGRRLEAGPVYPFVISSDGVVLLHAADLLQEGKNSIDLKDVNGYKIIRGLIDAAEAGGGFVEYYWDNPAVEGDEELGSPKVSYAEGFTCREGISCLSWGRGSMWVLGGAGGE